MLYTSFKNYEEFKQLFPVRVYDGRECRSNKILLSLYKSGRWFLHSPLRGVRTMPEMEDKCLELLEQSGVIGDGEVFDVSVMGRTFHSTEVYTDEYNGICEDGDTEKVRVHLDDNGRFKICKRKAGKFLRAIITENEYGCHFPSEVVNYLCEQFTTKWKAHVVASNPRYILHVNERFNLIYSRDHIDGDFGSCMSGRGYHRFYSEHLDRAKAAYIIDTESGLVAARAVIYNAIDESGRHWRLCERQYATVGSRNEILKQILVNKLIVAGEIDGYKAIGASCHDSTNFVDINGRSISEHVFSITCNLPSRNIVSYQDSFKYFYPEEGRAYNQEIDLHYINLATTAGSVTIRQNYDEYHQCYTRSRLVRVYDENGVIVNCAADRLEDFENIDGRFYRSDIVYTCRISGHRFTKCGSDIMGFYCEELDEWFASSSAAHRAVVEHEQRNYIQCADSDERHDPDECFYSELLDQYFWLEENLERAEALSQVTAA